MSFCGNRAKKTLIEAVAALATVVVVLGATPRNVSASCAEDVARSVQSHYDSIRDFRAEFSQTTRSVLFGAGANGLSVPSHGEVIFAKPGKMRWVYRQPEPSLVVSDGQTLWIYSPALKEAQRLPVTEGYLTGAALQFLLGEGKLLESFVVTSEACSLGADAGEPGSKISEETVELDLVPKQPASYQRLGLTAKVTTGAVVATQIVDLFGNETVITFDEVEHNSEPDAGTFRFLPGEGVEVIELQVTP